MNHPARIQRLREVLSRDNLPQLLVTDLLNVRWLSGFTGSNGQLLVDVERAVLVTDSRYTDQAASEVPSAVTVEVASSSPGDRANDHLITLADEHPSLGIEGANFTVAALDGLTAALAEAGSTLDPVPTKNLVADLRQTKDAAEIAALKTACQIADGALADILPNLRAGVTERDLARQLEWQMAERGSERPSFQTIVASGPNGARPHARPSERMLENGDLVVIDFGATVDGYGSDMTRTLVVGGKPTNEQSEWYRCVLAAQQAGVAAAVVGAELRDVHHTTLDHLSDSGQAGVYQHGTGHGVGLFIHENPILSPSAEGSVESAMALTIEPGAYVAGVGGIRVEDLLITSPEGPEPITLFPKGLVPAL
ncbi:MAG: M24 family metallopeptidase [Acidimicrobiales bacterium]